MGWGEKKRSLASVLLFGESSSTASMIVDSSRTTDCNDRYAHARKIAMSLLT